MDFFNSKTISAIKFFLKGSFDIDVETHVH